MTSRTSLIISGSSADVGSSKSITLGSIASARAMATRCCWPPESWAGYLFGLLVDADPRRAAASRAPRPRPWVLRTLIGPEGDVLEDRLVGEQVEALEHHPDLGAQRCERLALLRQRLAVERDGAAVDGLEPVDGAAQRRLAGAGRPDHHDDLAALDREVDVAQHVQVAEPLVDVVEDDEGVPAGTSRVVGGGRVRDGHLQTLVREWSFPATSPLGARRAGSIRASRALA